MDQLPPLCSIKYHTSIKIIKFEILLDNLSYSLFGSFSASNCLPSLHLVYSPQRNSVAQSAPMSPDSAAATRTQTTLCPSLFNADPKIHPFQSNLSLSLYTHPTHFTFLFLITYFDVCSPLQWSFSLFVFWILNYVPSHQTSYAAYVMLDVNCLLIMLCTVCVR